MDKLKCFIAYNIESLNIDNASKDNNIHKWKSNSRDLMNLAKNV